MAVALLGALGAAACQADGVREQAARALSTDDSYYYGYGDQRVALKFVAGQVGVLTRERAGRRQMQIIAAAHGLQIASELSGGMFLLSGGGLGTRPDVIAVARKLEQQYAQIIRDAGFVVMQDKDETPEVVTDELLVRFPAKMPEEEIKKLLAALSIDVARRGRGGTYRLSVTPASPFDALDAARFFKEKLGVVLAEPNLHFLAERFETIPADPFFASQWHHRNAGMAGGTIDADADTTLAWDLTMGSAGVIIAVVDNTFDLAHEDLAPNLYTNPGEIPANGLDDDGNGYIDDVNGWDFVSGDNNPSPVGAGDNHGTAVTGVAVARANNGVGLVGVCPGCRFVPLTIFNNCSPGGGGCASSIAGFAEAIEYAAFSDAQIITNSWGKTNPASAADAAVVASIDDATMLGKVVLFAGGNKPSSAYCTAGYPSLPNVIAVSSSSNLDRKVTGHATGNCIDVLAPTRWGALDPTPTGTLAITTSDRTGMAGYNSVDPECIGGLSEPGNLNYTNCFSGTSSATPLVAGMAGLLLSARPSLTRVEVQRLIQDTGDKVEDSLGAYATLSGFSQPVGGGTHSFGRVNAFEATRIAAPAPQGKDGVDIFLRDNRLDWGNTEQPSNVTFEPVRGFLGHWKSVDIKIDQPPYQSAPTDNAGFEALTDEQPLEGAINKVYVRVRNRGPVTAASVTVKLHWTQFGTALATLPMDFWSVFPADSADTTQWHPLGVQNLTDLAYSGASVAGCPGRPAPDCGGASDAAQIASFDWLGPSVAPMTPNHFCLFAVIDSPQDHVSASSMASLVPDFITPTDNNVTHRNVKVELAGGGMVDIMRSFYIRNPFPRAARSLLRLEAPKGWRVVTDGPPFGEAFSLKGGEQVLVTAKLFPPGGVAEGEVEIVQEVIGDNTRISGGAVFEFSGKK
jgi:subtilisin family serine protease